MKIDHLVPEVDRTGVYVLDYMQAETAIEGEHLLGMLHGERYMIESSDSWSLLANHPRSASQCACDGYGTDELSS
jgi:hypothetical protein